MNATILLGTLKKRGLSNTETLCEFVTGRLEAQSVTSRVIKLVDHEILPGIDGKAAGIVITGDSDGAQQIIGSLCNSLNGIGVVVPPYATLSVLWEKQAKGSDTTKEELLRKYESDYAGTADRMIRQLIRSARP